MAYQELSNAYRQGASAQAVQVRNYTVAVIKFIQSFDDNFVVK